MGPEFLSCRVNSPIHQSCLHAGVYTSRPPVAACYADLAAELNGVGDFNSYKLQSFNYKIKDPFSRSQLTAGGSGEFIQKASEIPSFSATVDLFIPRTLIYRYIFCTFHSSKCTYPVLLCAIYDLCKAFCFSVCIHFHVLLLREAHLITDTIPEGCELNLFSGPWQGSAPNLFVSFILAVEFVKLCIQLPNVEEIKLLFISDSELQVPFNH